MESIMTKLPNVIFEGPDATGKSTFINYLQEKYGYSSMSCGKHGKNDVQYFRDLLNLNNFAFDRHYISEYLFAILYNRERKLSFEDTEQLFKAVMDTGTILVMFTTSDISILNARFIERGEYDYLKEIDDQLQLFNSYIEWIEKANYENLYIVDIAEPDGYNKVYQWLSNKIEEVANGKSEDNQSTSDS